MNNCKYNLLIFVHNPYLMDFSGIDKIKINNAIVVFLIITTCLLYPLTILLKIDYKYFFEYDLIKVIAATLCVGCTNFSIVYTFTALISARSLSIQYPENQNQLFQRPILVTILSLLTIYTLTLINVNKNDLQRSISCIIDCDSAFLVANIGGIIVDKIKIKKRTI